MWLELLQWIGTFVLGGGLSMIFGWKYINAKAKAEAKQETKRVDSIEITNTQEIITVYKTLIEDIKIAYQSKESDMMNKIQEYELQLQLYRDEVQQLKTKLEERDEMIKSLMEEQSKLQEKVDKLNELLLGKCGTCTYSDTCRKYKDSINEE